MRTGRQPYMLQWPPDACTGQGVGSSNKQVWSDLQSCPPDFSTWGPQVNKYQQVSSIGHQISLARLRSQEDGARAGSGGSQYNMRPHVQGVLCTVRCISRVGVTNRRVLYVEVQCIMDNGHTGTPLLTEWQTETWLKTLLSRNFVGGR